MANQSITDFMDSQLSKNTQSEPVSVNEPVTSTQSAQPTQSIIDFMDSHLGVAPEAPSKASSSPVATTSPSTPSRTTAQVLEDNKNLPITSKIDAARAAINDVAQATWAGIEDFGTTIGKVASAGAHAISLPGSPIDKYLAKPEDIQRYYDETNKTYQENKKHNSALMGANLLGNVIGSAPIGAGGAVDSLAVKGFQAAGGGIPGLLAGAAGGSATGAIYGGAMNREGNPNLVNQEGAVQGAEVGALLGAVTGKIGSTAETMPVWNQTYKNLNSTINGKQLSFKGPTFDPTPNYNAGIIEKHLQNLPNLGILGGGGYEKEYKAIRPYVTSMINAVSEDTVGQSTTKIANALQRKANLAKQTMSKAWTDLPITYKAAGINKIDVSNSIAQLQKGLSENQAPISSALKTRIAEASKKGSLSVDEAQSLKQDIFTEYNNHASSIAKGSVHVDTKDLVRNVLQPAYHSIKDDIGNAAKGTVAEPAFARANSITKSYHKFFDPDTQPLLVAAVEDLNNQKNDVTKLINALTGSKTGMSESQVKRTLEMMGPQGRNELESIGLRKMAKESGIPELIDNNLNVANKSLDLSKMMTQVSNRTGDNPLRHVYTKSLDPLKGLEIIGQNLLKATQAPLDSLGGKVVNTAPGFADKLTKVLTYAGTAGGVGATIGHNPLLGIPMAGVALATMAMPKLASSAPLKRALSWVATVSENQGVQPQVTQYIMKRANEALLKAGIILSHQPDGSVMFTQDPNIK